MTPEQLRALHDEMDADDIALGLEDDELDLEADDEDDIDEDDDLDDIDDLVDDDGNIDEEEAMADEKLDHRDPKVQAILAKHEASLSPEELIEWNAASDRRLLELYKESRSGKRPDTSPATKPPVTKPAVVRGIGPDGVFRMTNSEARNVDFCMRTASARSGRTVEIIPE
jgi:hypothetical protein